MDVYSYKLVFFKYEIEYKKGNAIVGLTGPLFLKKKEDETLRKFQNRLEHLGDAS